MADPIRTEWDLGLDAYGRKVRLVRIREGGNALYEIHREAKNQLDERVWLSSLPRAVLESIAEVMGDHRG